IACLLSHAQCDAEGFNRTSAIRSFQTVPAHVPNGTRNPFLGRLTIERARCRAAASLWAILPPRRDTRCSLGRDSSHRDLVSIEEEVILGVGARDRSAFRPRCA